jgi:hypothetical protein
MPAASLPQARRFTTELPHIPRLSFRVGSIRVMTQPDPVAYLLTLRRKIGS